MHSRATTAAARDSFAWAAIHNYHPQTGRIETFGERFGEST